LRSGKKLEGPKGVRVEVESERGHNEGASTLSTDDVPQKNSESDNPNNSKPFSPNPYMPPLPFP